MQVNTKKKWLDRILDILKDSPKEKTDLLEISATLDRAKATLIQLLQQQDFSFAELSILTGQKIKRWI